MNKAYYRTQFFSYDGPTKNKIHNQIHIEKFFLKPEPPKGYRLFKTNIETKANMYKLTIGYEYETFEVKIHKKYFLFGKKVVEFHIISHE